MQELVDAAKELFNHPKYGTGLSIMAGFIVTTVFLNLVRSLVGRKKNK